MTSDTGNHWLQRTVGQWPVIYDNVRGNGDLSDPDKKDVLDGLKKLREIFGDEWLLERTGKGYTHPLLFCLANLAPSCQLSLADFGRKLHALKGVKDFKTLAARLRNSQEYSGAEAEVQILDKLQAAGMADIELHPKVNEMNKRPDFRAVVEGRDVYFEVAALEESQASIKAREVFLALTMPFWPDHEVLQFFQMYKVIAKPRVEETKAKLRAAISEVKQTKDHAYVGEPGVYGFLAVHSAKRDECAELAARYGMKQQVSGPVVERDDGRRLNRTVQEKVRQLPAHEPGMVVVFADLLFMKSLEEFYDGVAYAVEDAVYEHGNLIGLAVVSRVGFFGDGCMIQKPNFNLVTKARDGLVEETLMLIRNRYSEFRDIPSAQKVLGVFVS